LPKALQAPTSPSNSTAKVDWLALPEGKLSAGVEAEIRDLLVTAFPEFADFFSRSSYRGSVPEYRLVGRAATSELVAHLEFGCRQALVGTEPVGILGIGAVAVHPRAQGRGIGRRMFGALSQYAIQERLADFGFLECREAVSGFYERVSTAGGDAAGPRSRRHGPLMRRADSWPAAYPILAPAEGGKPMSTRVTSYAPGKSSRALAFAVISIACCGTAAGQAKDKWMTTIQTGASPPRSSEACVARDQPPFQMGSQSKCTSTEQPKAPDGARVWKLECEGGVTVIGRIRYSGHDAFEGESQMSMQGQTITTKMSGKRIGSC
jgi:GNAT superfamily N-acetyltransferase